MDKTDENPISEVQAEVKNAADEVKKEATNKSSEFVEDLSQTARSLFGNVKESASHVGDKVGKKVEKLVADPWNSLKNLGGKKQDDKKQTVVSESESESVSKSASEEATLPTSDKNIVGESSETDKTTVGDEKAADVEENPRSAETQPFVALSAERRASWMNCCGLLDVLKRSDE